MQILNLVQLERAALDRKAVVVPKAGYGKKPIAAAWYVGWPGRELLKAFRLGMFIYEKPKKVTNANNRS